MGRLCLCLGKKWHHYICNILTILKRISLHSDFMKAQELEFYQ
jgi:hypothetical protein